MHVLLWTWFILLARFIHCYENLSIKRTTTLSQSSTYNGHNASRANDGVTRTTENHCALTDPTSTNQTAWFQVDLGRQYSIKSVKIYYRREGDYPGDWVQYRFRQFYLDVSESPASSTTTSQRTRCYTDTTIAPNLPDNIIEIPCKQMSRYIIVETNYRYHTDPGPVLEICEIEVYGCATGRYGEHCSNCTCSFCDVVNGVCQNQCNPGCLQGQCSSNGYCTQGCINGYWGDTCTEQCSSTCSVNYCYRNGNCYNCKANYTGNKCETRLCPTCYQQMCDHGTGICSNGCMTGYYGNYCSKPCSDRCYLRICSSSTGNCSYNCTLGYYGPKCEKTCSATCSSQSCSKNDGACVSGCQNGYYGLQCRQRCSLQCKYRICDFYRGHCDRGCNDGYYGIFCTQSCSSNCARARCTQSNGFCSDGCLQNWTGNTCDSCVSTHYGHDCSLSCSNKCNYGTCNNIGYCDKDCLPGYFGYYCDKNCSSCSSSCDRATGDCSEECKNGYYGKDCKLICSTSCKGKCNKNNGTCDYGCIDGKFGETCQSYCSPGCHISCEKISGNCTCRQGWKGYKCNECNSDVYGFNCSNKCSGNCRFGHFDTENGTCLGGCKRGFLGDRSIQQSSESKTNNEIYSALYVVITILFFSILLNLYLIIRNIRKTIYKRQNTENEQNRNLIQKETQTKLFMTVWKIIQATMN